MSLKEAISKIKQDKIFREYSGGYDYFSYASKYGVPDQSKGQHLSDEYKLPSHVTFSDESIYSTPEKQGGHWTELSPGHWDYKPSKYVLENHSREELENLFNTDYAIERDNFGKQTGRSTLTLPDDYVINNLKETIKKSKRTYELEEVK